MSMLSERSGLIRKSQAINGDEIRKRIGLPSQANRWILLLVYPALTPMLAFRRQVGVRMVSFSRLLCAYLVMLLWGVIVGAILAAIYTLTTHEIPAFSDVMKSFFADQVRDQVVAMLSKLPMVSESVVRDALRSTQPSASYRGVLEAFASRFGTLFRPMFAFGLLTVAFGLAHRLIRWVSRQSGEQLNSKSLGISLLPLPIKNHSIERYLDPIICFVIGYFLLFGPLQLVGAWVIFCGLALAAVEKYVHEIQLDHYDALLNAEAHEQITSSYLGGMQKRAKSANQRKPIPTGMSKDVKQRMESRLQRLAGSQQAAIKVDDKPAAAKLTSGFPINRLERNK